MHRFDFSFRARIEERDFGRMAYKAVFVPREILAQLPLKEQPRLRLNAEIGGLLTNCGLMTAKRGRFLLLSAAFMRQGRLKLGQEIEVRFSVADPDAVDVPEELEAAIRDHPTARRTWDSLTSGKRRGFAYRVASAVQPETRERRVEEILDELRNLANATSEDAEDRGRRRSPRAGGGAAAPATRRQPRAGDHRPQGSTP